MSFIRARQRSITALFPHQGNKQFLVPKRGGAGPPTPTSYFDFAADSYITFNPVVPISSITSAMRIELLIRPDSLAPPYDNFQQGFIFSDILDPNFLSTQRTSPGQIRALFWDPATQFAQANMTGNFDLATYSWEAVVAPALVGTFTLGPTLREDRNVVPATGQFMIGTNAPPAADNAGTFLGAIAEVKIWLTNSDGTGPPDHYWKINEGDGETNIIDYGPGNSPGTLVPGSGVWVEI